MAEYSRFFDHIDGDRSYNADDFAEYFRQVLTSGILNGGENLQVYVNGTDRIARIKPGKAWIEGYFYKLTEELELPLDEAHGTYDRIDRIVVRLNTNTEERNIKAYVKTGSPASTPQPPAVTREGDIYELSLAQIKVIHNTTAVPTGNVTDERLDPNLCGLVNSLVQVDTTVMQERFETFMEMLEGQSPVSQEEFNSAIDQLFQSGLDGKNLLETSIESKGGTVSKDDEVATFDELDAGIQSIVTDPSGDATAEAGDILTGKTAYSQYKKLTGTMPNRGSKTFTPSDSTQSGSAGYYSGITVNPRPSLSGNASTSHVLSGRTFYGSNYTKQTGTMPNRGAPAKTLTTQGGQYNLPSGYYSGGYVKAQFANLIASNIRSGVNVGGVMGTYDGLTLITEDDSFYFTSSSSGYKKIREGSWELTVNKTTDNLVGFRITDAGVYDGAMSIQYDHVIFNKVNVDDTILDYQKSDGSYIRVRILSKTANSIVFRMTSSENNFSDFGGNLIRLI